MRNINKGGKECCLEKSILLFSIHIIFDGIRTIVIVDDGFQNVDGSAAMSGNSSAWTTDTELWTSQLVNPSVKNAPVSTNYVPSSNYIPSYIPMNLPTTGYYMVGG